MADKENHDEIIDAGGDAGADGAAGALADQMSLDDVAAAAAACDARRRQEAKADERGGSDAGDGEADGDSSGKGADDAAGEAGSKADDAAGFKPTEAQVNMARQLGLSGEEIAEMTPEYAKAIDRVARLDSRRQAKKGLEAKKGAGDGADDDGGEGSSADGDDGKVFDEETWGEAADVMNDLVAEVRELKAAVAGFQDGTNESINSTQKTTEAFFSGLDPEIFADFLPDDGQDVRPNSIADLRRTEVVEMAVAIHEKATAGGRKISFEESLDNALTVVAREEAEAARRKGSQNRTDKRRSQRIARPSARQTGGRHYETPQQRAAAAAYAELSS